MRRLAGLCAARSRMVAITQLRCLCAGATKCKVVESLDKRRLTYQELGDLELQSRYI